MASKQMFVIFFLLFLMTNAVGAIDFCNITYYVMEPRVPIELSCVEKYAYSEEIGKYPLIFGLTGSECLKDQNKIGDEKRWLTFATHNFTTTWKNKPKIHSWDYGLQIETSNATVWLTSSMRLIRIKEKKECLNSQELNSKIYELNSGSGDEFVDWLTRGSPFSRAVIINAEKIGFNPDFRTSKIKQYDEVPKERYSELLKEGELQNLEFYAMRYEATDSAETYYIGIEKTRQRPLNTLLFLTSLSGGGTTRVGGGAGDLFEIFKIVWVHEFAKKNSLELLDSSKNNLIAIEHNVARAYFCLGNATEIEQINHCVDYDLNNQLLEASHVLTVAEKISNIRIETNLNFIEEYSKNRTGSINENNYAIAIEKAKVDHLQARMDQLINIQSSKKMEALALQNQKTQDDLFNLNNIVITLTILTILVGIVQAWISLIGVDPSTSKKEKARHLMWAAGLLLLSVVGMGVVYSQFRFPPVITFSWFILGLFLIGLILIKKFVPTKKAPSNRK